MKGMRVEIIENTSKEDGNVLEQHKKAVNSWLEKNVSLSTENTLIIQSVCRHDNETSITTSIFYNV